MYTFLLETINFFICSLHFIRKVGTAFAAEQKSVLLPQILVSGINSLSRRAHEALGHWGPAAPQTFF